jgi:hypothetical protein
MLELLAGAALRSIFLAAAVGTGLWLRRTYNPHVSLTAWTLVLAASLLTPVAMRLTPIALPHGIIPVGIIPVGQLPLAPESSVQTEASPVTSRAEPSAPAASLAAPLAARPRWRELASFLYLAVFSALMLRLLAGLSLSWRIARAATPIREAWVGGFDVRASRRIGAPATFGSVILLPGDHAAWTPAKRLAVLAHEGAHVARRDFAIQLAAAVNRTIFWFNPFSWWLRRHLSDLAEAASDDAAIAGLNDRFGYAEILLEISGRVSTLPGAVSMARRAAIASRIERILSETPLPAGMSRRGRAMLAAGIVPLAVSLSFLIILPAPPPPQLPLSVGTPASVATVANEAAPEGVKQTAPPHAPAIVAVAMAPPPPASTEATAAPAVPPPAPAQRTEVASLPPPPSTSPPPRAPHPTTRNRLTAPPSRTMRQPNRTANNQGVLDQSPGPEAVDSVRAPSYSTKGPDPTPGAAGEGGQSPLFKRVVNETCRGTYLGAGAGGFPAQVRTYAVQAHFYRGPDDAPWVTFYFVAQKPADLPVTIRGSEIKFTSTYGAIYTLWPSHNVLLPPRYHRLTGSTEHPRGGTIDFACGESNHPL